MSVQSQSKNELKRLLSSSDPIRVIDEIDTPPLALINCADGNKERAQLFSILGYKNHREGKDFDANSLFLMAHELTGDIQSLINACITGRTLEDGKRTEKLAKTVDAFLTTASQSEDLATLYDTLCHNAGHRGDINSAAKFGQKSLQLKDTLCRETTIRLTERQRPKFDFQTPQRNVISFSLYGTNERYTRIAIENAKAVRYVYPGWSCRFYADKSVPTQVLDELVAAGAVVILVLEPHSEEKNSGLFWRFGVASDSEVDFFLVRDVDSLINVREKVAVDEWIASDRDFHLMRDFYTHSELILAGMWGGVAGRIPDIHSHVEAFSARSSGNRLGVHNQDQLFLRRQVWPAIRSSLMQHDSVFGCFGGRPFPNVGHIHPVCHVGQNMGIFLQKAS